MAHAHRLKTGDVMILHQNKINEFTPQDCERYKLDDLSIICNTPDRFMAKRKLEDGIDYLLRRKVNFKEDSHQQAYPKFWLLLRANNFTPKRFLLKLGNTVSAPSGSFYIFLPANTLSHWVLKPGIFDYETFISFRPADKNLPQYPVIFPFEKAHDINRYDDVVDLLRPYSHGDYVQYSPPSYLADKTKIFIDNYFTESINVKDMAKELHIPESSMTISFKDKFGIPPVQYRNILRTFESMRLVKEGRTITNAGFDAGFQSLAQYNVHFKRHFNVPPSRFTKLSI